MSTRAILILILAALGPHRALAAEGRFYLSSERIFTVGQEVSVNVEAQNLTALQLRVYRVEDPAAWLDAQRDLHRPSVEHAAPRVRAGVLLLRGLRAGLGKLHAELREHLPAEGRAALRRTFPELEGSARAGRDAVPRETTLPPLSELPLVEAWEQPLSAAEGWAYDRVPLPVRELGVYLVEAASADRVATTLVVVSDLALVTKQSARTLLVWAVDAASGAPRADVEILVSRDGEALGAKKTDPSGLARFPVELAERLVVYGRSGRSFALLDPRFYASNLPEPRVYLYTERPVYRPGQEVFWKGFARKVEGGSYAPLPESELAVELLDPEGRVVSTAQAQLTARGSMDGSFMLPSEPPLGTWQLVVQLDGQRHAGQFKVLAFVKPEVRLGVRADRQAVTAGERLSGAISGQYFFGAPYPGAEVKITLSRTRFSVPWWVDADYKWYYSDAEYRSAARESLEEHKCTLDERGECPFAFDTKVEGVDHTYLVEAAALDPAGRTITGSAQIAVTTGQFRLAIEPGPLVVPPGGKREVVVRAIDYSGQPARAAITLTVQASRSAGGGVETLEVLRDTRPTGEDGRARFSVPLARGGYYSLRAVADDPAGHTISEEGFVFSSEGKRELPFAPTELEIVTDKQSYFAGEKALALVLVPAPEASVLFTVEGGERATAEVVKAVGHAALVEVPIGVKETPNFFLGAVVVTGGQVFTKQRSVIVPPRESLLRVEVAPEKAEARPGEKVGFTVLVTDHLGKPVADAEVALGVVDEAIYAISPELAVPIETFYHPRRRNDVRTHESLSFRFFGSSKAQELARRFTGEGEPIFGSLKPQLDDVRKVFRDTAAWFPSGVTGVDGRVRVQVSLPDNLTSWRATARVMTRDARVGSGTAALKARKPLMLSVGLPPRLVEGDRGTGALVVQSFAGKPVELELELSAQPLPGTLDPSPPRLALAGLAGKLSLRDGELRRIPFTYTASGSGVLSVVARAKGGGLDDAVEARVPVEEWAVARRVSARATTSETSPVSTHTLRFPDGASPSEAHVEIELVSSPVAAIQGALPYLVEYPYGCTEQTMSRFVPLLAAQGAIDALQLEAGELAKTVPAMLGAGLARIAQLQHEDGGWGWWENDASDPWMTAWVVEGLAEAKRWEREVDAEMVRRGVDALEAMLAAGKLDAAARAFAVMALARHERAPAGMIQAIAEETRPLSLAYLALAADDMGKRTLAQEAIAKLRARAQKTPDGGLRFGAEGAADPSDDAVEVTAFAVLAMVEVGGFEADARAGAAWLLGQFEDGRFGTTRQTALAVRAIAGALVAEPRGGATLTVSIDGKAVATESFDARRAAQAAITLRPAVALGARATTIEIRQEGGSPVLHAVVLVAPVRGRALSAQTGGALALSRSYLSLSGRPGAREIAGPAARFSPGETVLVRLELRASKPVPYVMIEDPRPAGLAAVEGDSGYRVEGVELRPGLARREHRDDRTSFFIRALPKGTTTLYYVARAGLPGELHALPARAESMYLPNLHHAQSTSAGLEIR